MIMLFVFVEGMDDKRFFEWYFKKNNLVKIITYKQMKKEKINNFLSSITSMKDSDYVFLADSDTKNVEERKKEVDSKYKRCDLEKIFIVETEIESWYLAGLDNNREYKYMKIKNLENTDHITKEDFNNMINIKEKTNIFIEILKNFDRSIARNKNTTFKIFDESRIAV